MLDILGFKRVLTLLMLCAVNAVLALAWYYYLVPEVKEKRVELQSIRGETAELASGTQDLHVSELQIEQQKQTFIDLQAKGFFNHQDRREAELLLNEIQEKAYVNKATISIGKANKKEHPEAIKAGHVLLESPLKINITAMDDIDMMAYGNLLQTEFPGYLSLDSLVLERKGEINNPILRAIASGELPDLVAAEINYTWQTLIPDENTKNQDGGFQ